jgi:hypothetical protein
MCEGVGKQWRQVAGMLASLRLGRSLFIVWALSLATPWTAYASRAGDALLSAQKSSQGARYVEAIRQAEQALQFGDATPDQLWQIHALLGELFATVGDLPKAVLHFETALELHPEYQLADGVSPRLAAPFAQARRSTPAALRIDLLSHVEGARAVTSVSVSADERHVVQNGRLVSSTGEVTSLFKSKDAPFYSASWPCPHPPCQATGLLLDEWGNTVRSLDVVAGASLSAPRAAEAAVTKMEAPRLELAAPAPTPTPPRRAWYERPGPWLAAAGVALAVTGGYFAARAGSDHAQLVTENGNRPQYTYVQAASLQSRLSREQAYMWVGFGAAAACTVGAVFTW